MTSLSDSTLLSKQINGIIYCTTNLINFKKYIGLDSHNNPNYLGSGTLFKRSLKLHGKENFKQQILETCNNWEDLLEAEIYWIDYFGAVKSDMFYNIAPGGEGGYDVNNHPDKESIIKRITETTKQNYINNPEILLRKSISMKKTLSNDPTISKRRIEKLKQTLLENPQILIEKAKKYSQTLADNPSIMVEREKKRIETLKNDSSGKEKGWVKFHEWVRNRQLIKCPHCSVSSYGKGSMVVHHFDNCKLKPKQ